LIFKEIQIPAGGSAACWNFYIQNAEPKAFCGIDKVK